MTILRVVSIAALVAAAGQGVARDAGDAHDEPTADMLAAGTAAARRALPPGMLDETALTSLAATIHAAMTGASWRPIASAPQDGRFLLLGGYRDGVFQRGIGCWQVDDAPDRPGFWTVTDWFGAPPSHWMPLPPPPP